MPWRTDRQPPPVADLHARRRQHEVIVGEPRKRYRRKTGPHGGYIKDADLNAWGEETGGIVTESWSQTA
jgi:hypothetical protein